MNRSKTKIKQLHPAHKWPTNGGYNLAAEEVGIHFCKKDLLDFVKQVKITIYLFI